MIVKIIAGWLLILLPYHVAHVTLSLDDKPRGVYCTPPELKEGAWIRRNRTSKTYVCCGDGGDYQNPEIKQFCIGGPIFRDHGCICDEFQHTRLNVSERENWMWKPSANCDIMDWSPITFCNLLGTRKVLFVGDSTMEQTYGAFVSMLKWSANGTSCASQLSKRRIEGRLDNTGLEDIKTGFAIHKPDIIIAGFGAHYTHFGLNFTLFEDHMKELLILYSNLKRIHKDLQFVWKTNNPGHINCDNSSVALIPPLQDEKTDKYYWRHFPQYDDIFHRISKDMNLDSEIHTLNVQALYLRPDSHPGKLAWDWIKRSNGDCLHFCAPGALDLIPILFTHSMLYNFSMSVPSAL